MKTLYYVCVYVFDADTETDEYMKPSFANVVEIDNGTSLFFLAPLVYHDETYGNDLTLKNVFAMDSKDAADEYAEGINDRARDAGHYYWSVMRVRHADGALSMELRFCPPRRTNKRDAEYLMVKAAWDSMSWLND